MEMTTDEFLPRLEMPSTVLARLWNYCVSVEKRGAECFEHVAHSFESDLRQKVVCAGLAETGEARGSGRLFVKLQNLQSTCLSASTLQITKSEMLQLCEDLKHSISVHYKGTVGSPEEADEISRCVSGFPRKSDRLTDALDLDAAPDTETLPEKVLEAEITDYMKLGYVVAVDQVSHKLLGKVLAMVPNVAVMMRPIKGFAVVSTPMSAKLLEKRPRTFQSGFLTLDKEKRLVALHASDPRCSVYTLIGIWVTGLPLPPAEALRSESKTEAQTNDDRRHKINRMAERESKKAQVLRSPQVMAAILRFLFSEEVKSRISPRERRGEVPNHRYLLVNFFGGTVLPQFLEFELHQQSEKSLANSWMMLESAYTVAREPRNTFKPVSLKLTCEPVMTQENGYYCVYKLANILSSLQQEKGKREGSRGTENCDPNASYNKSKKYSQMTTTLKAQHRSKPCLTGSVSKVQEFFKFSNSKAVDNIGAEFPEGCDFPDNCDIKKSLTFVNRKPETAEEDKAAYLNNNQEYPPQLDDMAFENMIDATCMQTSQLPLRTQQYAGDDQFPSYSANVSLLRTPEYSTMEDPHTMQMIIENSRCIKAMQQYIEQFTKELALTQGSLPTGCPTPTNINNNNASSYICIEEKPASQGPGLSMSSDTVPRGKTPAGQQKLNLSQSSASFVKGTDNNSSTNNSLNNLNKLIPADKDSTSELQQQLSHTTEGSRNGQKGLSFTLDASKIEARKDSQPDIVPLPPDNEPKSSNGSLGPCIEPDNDIGTNKADLMKKDDNRDAVTKEVPPVDLPREISIDLPKIIDPVDLTMSSNGSVCPLPNFNISDHTVSPTAPLSSLPQTLLQGSVPKEPSREPSQDKSQRYTKVCENT